jgi:hypothetical protein
MGMVYVSDRLYIPPKTQLHTVWRVDHGFLVMTDVPDRNAPFNRLLGTGMLLRSDGSVTRVTINPDGSERHHEVMPRRADD